MRTISGFQVTEQVHESVNSLILRGYRESDQVPVILKMLKDSYPSPEKIARFQREYTITKGLDLAGVIAAYALEQGPPHWVMVLEDFGGKSLNRLDLAGTLSVAAALRLAISLAETLGQIHQQQVIHKDINPSNIVYNPATGQIKLIDFGISTMLSRETPTFRNPNVLEGTLAYMSPEQTGRMNRAVDYRSDFYSFGATLYELLTGQVPFLSTDALELVHSHIARQPTLPHLINPVIPISLSSVILKLMAKNAEERYQSAYGLKADLEACLQQAEHGEGAGRESFVLGQHDLSDRLIIPQKLYGREREVADLLAAFDRVCAGTTELVLVIGAAGIGKSALVHEVHRPMSRQRGYFIAGKFDQLQRDIPYSALIQAFRALVRQMLTESEGELAAWRKRLLAALGPNGQVIIEIIPEVEFIIGPQPPPPEVGPAESRNRFNLVFQRFIQLFTLPQHPLVLFVDDMQWADSASLALLERLLTAPADHEQPAALLVIGSYRDSDVAADHPLHRLGQALEQAEIPCTELWLDPLSLDEANRLVAETLHRRQHDETLELTAVLLAKTGGNPFFLAEFLLSLDATGLLLFDHAAGRWQWNLADIQTRQITDNVVELMTTRVEQLSPSTREILRLAACIGNRFDLAMLAIIAEQSPARTAIRLDEALVSGLVVPLGDEYRLMTFDVPGLARQVIAEYAFAHDRIQQAVYAIIPDEQKQLFHWHIGMLLLHNTPQKEHDEHVFDLVSHLNYGRARSTHQQERDTLATLNLAATRKAKASAAYQQAHGYVQVGLELLGPSCWTRRYELALALHVEAAEVAYLNGDFDQSEHLASLVLNHAHTTLDAVKVYEIKIVAAMARMRLAEAVQTALHVLGLLGISLPEAPDTANFMAGLEEVTAALANRPIEALHELPPMTDPTMLAAMRILTSSMSAAYLTAPLLSALITFKEVALSLTHGKAPMSPFAYGMYGFILCGILGDITSGHLFGELALSLADHPESREFRASTIHVVNAGVRHWKEHIRLTLPALMDAYQGGLETGDIQYAANAAYMHIVNSFLAGVNLEELAHEKAAFGRTIAQLKQESARLYHEIYRQVVLNLMGKSAHPIHLVGEAYDETVMLPAHQEASDQTALHLVHSHKLMLCYLFHEYEQAVAHADLAEQTVAGVTSSPQVPFFYFYDALARLALLGSEPAPDPAPHLEKVAASQEKLKAWAEHAPMNYLHRWHLLEAERAHFEGQAGTAWEHYHRACALAHEHHHLPEEALANERLALFYRAQGETETGDIYLRKAHHAYLRWGAHARAHDMEERYHLEGTATAPALPQVLHDGTRITVEVATAETLSLDEGSTSTPHTLDFSSVFKASQAISSEIRLDALLAKLMDTMIENAGAERGVLLLDKEGQWFVEAEGNIGSGATRVLHAIPIHAADVPRTIINYVAHTRESVVLDDAAHEGDFTQDGYVVARRPRAVLCIPLIHQGKLTAILYLENNQTTGAFTAERRQVLNLLYGQVAISIENARLYADIQASERKYRTLFEGSRDTIFISTPEGRLLDINPAGLALFGYSREEVTTLYVQDFYAYPDDRQRFLQEIFEQGSVRDFDVTFCRKDGTEIECLMTATVRRAEDGTPTTFHGILRDVTEQKRAERERLQLTAMQRELSIARSIQQSLLPAAKPDWQGAEIVCYTAPAREVGGDLYAYHAFETNHETTCTRKCAIAVGDVSGKGVPAALLMAVSVASFRSLVEQGFSPGTFLARMDSAIAPHTRSARQNCALIYVEICQHDTTQEQQAGKHEPAAVVRIANAGCIAPLVKQRGAGVSWVDVGGLPLGVELAHTHLYAEAHLNLATGDMLILISDGVVEAINENGELFGFERLEQVVQSGPQHGAPSMLVHIRQAVEAFVGRLEPHDDMSIVVVQL